MRHQSGTPVVIVSAEQADRDTATNISRTKQLRAEATRRGLAFTPCVGVWDGVKETSTIVDASGRQGREFARWAIAQFGQQCALYIDRARRAVLWHADGRTEPIGRLENGNLLPIGHGAKPYTYVPSLKTYYWTVAE